MRIFNAFLIVMAAGILFMLPFTEMGHDFRTRVQEDSFGSTTAAAQTTENVTLTAALFDDAIAYTDISSNLTSDVPISSSYNATSRQLNMGGLTASQTHTLTVTYDVDALEGSTAINNLMDRVPWIWLLVVIAFAPAALIAIFTGRA